MGNELFGLLLYGMVYEHDLDAYVYAFDADISDLFGRSRTRKWLLETHSSIADGKVYVQMGEYTIADFLILELTLPDASCYDACAGELTSTFPIEAILHSIVNASHYRNLYVVPTPGSPTKTWRVGVHVPDRPPWMKSGV